MITTQTQTKDMTERDRDTRTTAQKDGDDSRPARDQQPSGSQERSGPWLGWLVVAVAFVAAIGLVVASAFGGSDSFAGDAAGSDVHLQNLAADIANRQVDVEGSDQRLNNLAADIANRQADVDGSDQRLHNQAAEIANRQAGVDGSDQHLHNIANQRSGS